MKKGYKRTPEIMAKIRATKLARYPLEKRFWPRVIKQEDGCWVWTGAKNPDGYGRIWWGDRLRIAHHVPMLLQGIEPPKYPMVCDHLCKNRACVNPDHIRIVTQGVNTLENSNSPYAKNAALTHCSTCGGPYSGSNLGIKPYNGRTKKGGFARVCLTCYPEYWLWGVVQRDPPKGARNTWRGPAREPTEKERGEGYHLIRNR